MGMSLFSFSIDGCAILDSSRKEEFFKSRKGLGPIIFPHFNRFAFVPDESPALLETFDHINFLKELGVNHPFQHGIGRYLPWEYKVHSNRIIGTLSSSTNYRGFNVGELAGCRFNASLEYNVDNTGLNIHFVASADKPIHAGIHYYYDLVKRDAATIAVEYPYHGQEFFLEKGIDLSVPAPCAERILLITPHYKLRTIFESGHPGKSDNVEAVIIFSPKGASFACIEPISSIPSLGQERKEIDISIRLEPEKLIY